MAAGRIGQSILDAQDSAGIDIRSRRNRNIADLGCGDRGGIIVIALVETDLHVVEPHQTDEGLHWLGAVARHHRGQDHRCLGELGLEGDRGGLMIERHPPGLNNAPAGKDMRTFGHGHPVEAQTRADRS